jgi:hypothetical protein
LLRLDRADALSLKSGIGDIGVDRSGWARSSAARS